MLKRIPNLSQSVSTPEYEASELKYRDIDDELSDGQVSDLKDSSDSLNKTESHRDNLSSINPESTVNHQEEKSNKLDTLYEDDDNNDDDLLIMDDNKREPRLAEKDYPGTVGEPRANRELTGRYGPWTKITIPFEIINPMNGEVVTVKFVANKSLKSNSRLFPILKGIIGGTPKAGLDLRELKGKKVIVTVEHEADDKGNVWEVASSVRPYRE